MALTRFKYTVGVDEVGRGPIAGPLAVGAIRFENAELRHRVLAGKLFAGVKDSKQLTPLQREYYFDLIDQGSATGILDYAVSFVGSRVIDQVGISRAIKLATARSLARLSLLPDETRILLDGLLTAPRRFTHQKTIVRGDEKEPVIALASIVAKVLRDRRMMRYGLQYPGYDFELHKGYGTQRHFHHISNKGLCALHRRSFL